MTAAEDSIEAIVVRAEETLFTAKLGLGHLGSQDPRIRAAGLRNAIVFGRAVTNVLQNLRSKVPEFDDWYQKRVEVMKKDEPATFFYQLRSRILKQGELSLSSSVAICGNSMEILRNFETPPRARAFFIGDRLGGSGREVETASGEVERYYVQIPDGLPGLEIDIDIHLTDVPAQYRDIPATVLCTRYLDYLSTLVADARHRFVSKRASSMNPDRRAGTIASR